MEKITIGGSRRVEKYFDNGEGEFRLGIFVLSDIEKTFEREVYTFMAVLGDFGGFNDGIVFIPAILMSIYSNKMYLMSLFALLPVKRVGNSKIRDEMNDRCSDAQPTFQLTHVDTELLSEESKQMNLKKNSWCKNLCYTRFFCKRDRGVLLQEKAIEHFEDQLDIRSIVKTRIDLSILLSLLLSKEQLLLFRCQHARAFSSYDSSKKKSKPMPRDDPVDSLLNPDFISLPRNDIK